MRSLTSIAALCVLIAALALGASLGGGVGRGVWLGASVATLLALGGASLQRWALTRAPKKIWHAVAAVWFAKLAVATAGAAVLRNVDSVADWADWRSYLISFATAATVVTLASTLENVRFSTLGRERREARVS